MTNDQLEIITNTRLGSSPDQFYILTGDERLDVTESEFRRAYKSLLPLEGPNSYKGPFEIELHYFAGMDPDVVLVHIEDDHLYYLSYGAIHIQGWLPFGNQGRD